MVQSSTSELQQHTTYSSLYYSRRKSPTELKNVSIGSSIRSMNILYTKSTDKKEKKAKRPCQQPRDKASKRISIDYERSRSKRRSAVPSFVAESAAMVAVATSRNKHRTVAAAAAAAARNHHDDGDSWADMNDESSSFYMNALMEAIDSSSDEEKGNDSFVSVDHGRTRRRSAMPSLSLRNLMIE